MRKKVAKELIHYLFKYQDKIRCVLFIVYSAFIVYYAVLSRESSADHRIEFRFMWSYREMLTGHPEWKEDVGYNLKNIVFFIPFGFLFPKVQRLDVSFKNRTWLIVLCCGFLLSLLVEVSQYIFCLGLCELDDLICNGLGALLGYWLLVLLHILSNRILRR